MGQTYHQRRFSLPDDATEVVLVRHGASKPAVEGQDFDVVDGHADPPLDVVGHEQAAAVGARLAAGDAIDAIFTSGLTRTRETAAPLVAATGLQPTEIPALREVFLGEWEGATFRIRMQTGDPTAMRVLAEQRWDVIPGAESNDGFAARVRAGMEEVVAATGLGRRAVVFVHGGVVGELCRQATESRPFAFVHAENTSISRIVVFAAGFQLLRDFNDVTHLGAPSPAG